MSDQKRKSRTGNSTPVSQRRGKSARSDWHTENTMIVLTPPASDWDIDNKLYKMLLANPYSKYKQVRIPPVSAMLRVSSVPRRGHNGPLNINIVQIEVDPSQQKMGYGTLFFKSLMKAAKKMERGVYLEQAITPASQALAKKLVREGLATQFNNYSFLSKYE